MPNGYELQLERRARRALGAVQGQAYERLQAAIVSLADDPRPPGCVKLQGRAPGWRIRVGEYRIVYAIFDRERIVKVINVARHTTQTYRRTN